LHKGAISCALKSVIILSGTSYYAHITIYHGEAVVSAVGAGVSLGGGNGVSDAGGMGVKVGITGMLVLVGNGVAVGNAVNVGAVVEVGINTGGGVLVRTITGGGIN